MPRIAQIALVVRDYDEALAFYVGKLGFTLVEDSPVPEQGKRWVVIAPPGAPEGGANLLLARAATPGQERFVGDQAGGRVFLFLATDDFARDHAAFTAAGVHFLEPPRDEPYGKVAVFEDLYGNRWDLIEHAAAPAREARPLASALSAPQVARAGIHAGKFAAESEARATPLGLLAIGALTAAILWSVPPIIRAGRARR